ncbi:hypothetical protein ACIBCD_33450 [Nocardia brasiliensis]|uniref:hypothetical protein n=1 Tax=Nocardia brasiliensis TaxID=37326 RepID=UPI00379256D3
MRRRTTAAASVTCSDKALVFFAVHQGLFGLYMGCIFAPNHEGMPTLTPRYAALPARMQDFATA